MKTKSKTTRSKPKADATLSFYSVLTNDEADQHFRKSLGNIKDDTTLEIFLTVMKGLTSGRGSFMFSDITDFARPFALDLKALTELFKRWKKTMLDLSKLEEWPGLDEPVYVYLG